MGKEKYQHRIEELFKKSPVVSYKSIEKIVKDKRKVKQYTKQLIRNLLSKKKIRKLSKGQYTIRDDPSLAVFCFKPAYLGLQDALSFHNLWEQETIPVIVTSRKVRPGLRAILGMNVMVRRIKQKYLFGFDYLPQKEIYYPYSDIEKTLIDMIYFKEALNKETISSILKNISMERLHIYLKNYPSRIKKTIIKIIKNNSKQKSRQK